MVATAQKYRLLAGVHSDGEKHYVPGDLIESTLPLDRFNGQGLPPKFEKIHADSDGSGKVELPPQAQVWDPARETIEAFAERMGANKPVLKSPVQAAAEKGGRKHLSDMSEKELTEVAANEEIDIRNAKGKDAIIKVLKAAGIS